MRPADKINGKRRVLFRIGKKYNKSVVKTGLDILLSQKGGSLRGQKVGLIVHPASVDSSGRHILDALQECPEVRVAALFAPEHGLRGEAQDQVPVPDSRCENLPVYSLYGDKRAPEPGWLREIDALVFDLQDVGARYYTFVWTMALSMRSCRQAGKRFVVLDRPNPITGEIVEGNVLDPDFSSFVGLYPVAVRHGMTPGELARFVNERFGIGCELEVVPLEGWDRRRWFDETGLPWVKPSPNMVSLATATVYPGACLVEGANLSEGRGTERPFEIVGAPFIDSREFSAALNAFALPGVEFKAIEFVPTFHKGENERCGGVLIEVKDRAGFKPYVTGLALLKAAREICPREFAWRPPPYEYEEKLLPIDILCGTDAIRKSLEAGGPLEKIEASWRKELKDFKELRKEYLLY
jgi:uncharacterized protein YbbC (DUF1343 family)